MTYKETSNYRLKNLQKNLLFYLVSGDWDLNLKHKTLWGTFVGLSSSGADETMKK